MPMVMVDLRAAAEGEGVRVMRARTVRRDGDDGALARLEAGGTWIARAARTQTRRVLGSRALLVWRVAHEDAGSRSVESTLVAIAVQLACGRRDVSAHGLELASRPHVDAAARGWHESAAQTAHAFGATRIARESAMARASGAGGRAYQPGLFDRRAERRRLDEASASAATEQAAAHRLASLERRTAIRLRPAELLLVLLP